MGEIKKKLRDKNVELVALLAQREPEREGLSTLTKEIDSLQTELLELVIDQILLEKENLTPEQQKKFFSLMTDRLCPDEKHHDN